MKVRTTLEFDTVDGSVKVVDINRKESGQAPADAAFPMYLEAAQHTFTSQQELDDWVAAVKRRDANLVQYPAEEAKNYTGSIDPDALEDYDWAFYVKTPHLYNGSKDYAIFKKKPIIRHNNGAIAQNPDAEFASIDVSGYKGPLKDFA
jgi:hypothetical protein